MLNEGLLKKADGITPYFYHLISHKKAYNIFNYKHEKIGADIYIALHYYLDYWSATNHTGFETIKPDRLSRFYSDFGGERILWEIDRSTMTKSKIIAKVGKYIKLAKSDGRYFSVVFAASTRRSRSLLTELAQFKNANVYFYTVDYKELTENPTGQIFNSPTKERVTLLHPYVPQETLV